MDYVYESGPDIDRPQDEVILKDVLRQNLASRYLDPQEPSEATAELAWLVSDGLVAGGEYESAAARLTW